MKQVDGKTFQSVRLRVFDTGDMGLETRQGMPLCVYIHKQSLWRLVTGQSMANWSDPVLLEALQVTSQYPKETHKEQTP